MGSKHFVCSHQGKSPAIKGFCVRIQAALARVKTFSHRVLTGPFCSCTQITVLQGATSRIIGRWLKSQKRQDFVIATKVAGGGRAGLHTRNCP